MSSKESKSFEKFLKQIFRGNKNVPGQNNYKLKDEVISITPAMEHEISNKVSVSDRIRALKELSSVVQDTKLEEFGVEKLCRRTEDILQTENSKELRHTGFQFYQCLIRGQFDRLGLMRTYFFKIIKTHEHIEDNIPRLELFMQLTNNGKIITSFEEEVGPFLLDWMPVMVAAGKASDFLLILVNYIKYNAAFVDDDVINGIVQNTSYLCCKCDTELIVTRSLQVLDTIVCYSNISQQTMAVFISALSRTVSSELYNSASYKIMRNLLGTHMGHFCLQTMCLMLQEEDTYNDTGLVSGIIFNINMALLHNKPDVVIGYIPTFVIPSVFKAVRCHDPIVLMEVCVCIKWLVEKYGRELKDPFWDRIFAILDILITKIQNSAQWFQCQLYVLDIFNKIEVLLKNNLFKGSLDRLFTFLHQWYLIMPESLIFRLIDHLAKFVIPTEQDWIAKLELLLSTFYFKEKRTVIRTKILYVLAEILEQNRFHHEKEIIASIISPYFNNIAYEEDEKIKNIGLEYLLKFCIQCKTSHMELILDILEKVLKVPFEDDVVIKDENECKAVITVIKGLLDLFVLSIYQLPPSNAIRILSILVFFLQNHYRKPLIFDSVIQVRWMIINCFLKLRSDSKYRLGYSNGGVNVKYSSYLIVDYRRSSNISISALSNSESRSSGCSSFDEEFVSSEIMYVSLSNACQIVVTALKSELDWKLLELILRAIPSALKNKALILSKYNSDVEPLVKALISMITDGNLPDSLKNSPAKFTKPDFYNFVIPVLSAFASYHSHLEIVQQQGLIKSLELGLVNKSAPQCVTALMTCLLEMKEAMVKLLPEVLLNLSKISASVPVAIPTLEFLSMLATFPKVFANFTPHQFMSIFAIIFPYTNPFKYHHYVVSLAHHVIAVWFLKCRKPLRRDFVKYIITGLRTNAFGLIDDNELQNEDSSNRKRSSSLTEQGSKQKERHMSGSGRLLSSRTNGSSNDSKKDLDEKLIIFHRELTETCIDLMSRVAFTSCSALPRRHPSSEFVFHNGQSQTWLLGTKLVTVTTSSCTQKPIRNGLCDKCSTTCILKKDLEYKQSSSPLIKQDNLNFESIDKDKQSSNTVNSLIFEDNHSDNVTIQSDVYDVDSQDQCVCWCQGWAEIHIRKPTGDISWVMRLQNDTNSFQFPDPFIDISTLYQPSVILEGIKTQEISGKSDLDVEHITEESLLVFPNEGNESSTASESGIFSSVHLCSINSDSSNTVMCKAENNCIDTKLLGNVQYSEQSENTVDLPLQDEKLNDQDYCCHGRNPVRRSNSSPEMSSSWKNSFLKDSSRSFNSSPVNEFDQCGSTTNDNCMTECRKLAGKSCYSKELRCNCEAIPEEFAGQGSTPPKSSIISDVKSCNEKLEANTSCNSTEPRQPINRIQLPLTLNENSSLLPSFSYEDVNPKFDHKIIENKFFDKQSLPNDHFEFNRSASVSQVVPPFKKTMSTATYSGLSHNLTCSQPHLTTKPPLSPPTSSLRFFSKHSKDYSSQDSQLNQDYPRHRLHTISVMSPSKKGQNEWDLPKTRFKRNESKKSGVNPSFVFLQLFDMSQFCNLTEKPLLVPSTPAIQRAVNVFDRIPPYETHKVGVIYVGPGQANNETEILRNPHGSTRYADFLSKLGTLVTLADVNPQNIFLGGLEQNGNDGKFAYIWKDDVMQVIFHVATLMPNKENDLNCHNKKKHIGNDYVTIVYNESETDYDLHTVKCQFNFACVIIEPLDHGSNQVIVKARDDLLKLIGLVETKIVSDKNVSLLARQLALHINLASMILSSLNKDKSYGGIYASNWLERLRKIKHIKNKVLDEFRIANPNDSIVKPTGRRNYMCDFTEFT